MGASPVGEALTIMDEHEASIRQAIFTKETQTRGLRRLAVAMLALSPIVAVGWRPDQPLHYLIGAFWALAVMLPAGWWFLRGHATHAVEVIVGDPETYVRTQQRPAMLLLAGEAGLCLMPGFWLSIASLTTLVAPMLALVVLTGAASTAFLFTFIFGSGLQALCDAEVWRRYGHRGLMEESGIDPAEVMAERGYRWTWWAGWLQSNGPDGLHGGAKSG